MKLYEIVKKYLKENENIFILRKSNIPYNTLMSEFTFDEIFNVYSYDEKVLDFWHENGLCIILEG